VKPVALLRLDGLKMSELNRVIAKREVRKGDAVILGENAHRFKVYPANWIDSCDNCSSQQGRHYCLLHSTQMRDMNTVRCDDWTE
jgi:hypothetical protein